ncbi:processed acidic surface protein [Litchfieldia salsa]|uniref:Processed acidic surface protein n=1 Tax=Litchfieldia salsa TaxID=930152 RepID=A0A1H0WYW2_9BACI|nr:processed acidic surface protein [Litchfieldia salsa]SDP95810.1 processed acidic surface protein [Litchfieldia salsa]
MIRIVVVCLTLFFVNLSTSYSVFAAVSDEEVSEYIERIGITQEELTNYLSFYHLSIEEFESVSDLDSFLGTPINTENLNHLLTAIDLSEEELHTLLAGFGESIDDYLFIEDLEVDVNFYLKHAEMIHEAERLLSDIGMTSEEADELFGHIISLNKNGSLEDELETISINLEQYYAYDTNATLSDEQKNELITHFENLLSALHLSSSYYVMNNGTQQPTTLENLLTDEAIEEEQIVVVQLNNDQNETIMDLQLKKDELSSDFLILRGEQFLTMATLANELNGTMMTAELPNTASPFWNNMMIGLTLFLLGWWIILRKTLSRRES